MSRILLTAPYVGEIGWELMTWQARVRWEFLHGSYDRVIVLGAAGKAAFYAGMPVDYRDVDLDCLPGAAYEDRRIISASGQIVAAGDLKNCVSETVERAVIRERSSGNEVDVLWPEYCGRLWPCEREHQSFIRYQRCCQERPAEPWVVLVQRTRAFENTRNWPQANWDKLAGLLNARGVHTTVYACNAEAAIEMLSACDLAIGQSTGGLHLAALCGCPTMVWSVQRYLMWPWEITNRQRYETWWNPLGSPLVFHDVEELPGPEQAADQTLACLHAIGRRTGSTLRRAAFRVKWMLRSALRRRIIQPRRYAGWPWPVQRFLRYGLA